MGSLNVPSKDDEAEAGRIQLPVCRIQFEKGMNPYKKELVVHMDTTMPFVEGMYVEVSPDLRGVITSQKLYLDFYDEKTKRAYWLQKVIIA